MSTYKSDFLNVLDQRGFINQISEPEALDALARTSTITGYIGFDCTAPSLHIGSLLPIMMLYWLQQTGHRPIALMGGGTTRVGDPSGKDESRRLLTDDVINENLKGIRAVFTRFLRFDDDASVTGFHHIHNRSALSRLSHLMNSEIQSAIMANNADWLDTLNYIDFLRDVGRHFSINRMLAFDSVKLRLERQQELSFLEFNYMILQAYDFVELYRRTGCVLQMGGSDQWGNIVSGIDLGRRLERAQLFAVTSPLITTSSGAKMGKTAAGAVWLNADLTDPYEYWQFWRNTNDADVGRFLKLFTTLPLDEINRRTGLQGEELNEAKKILATEATSLVHGYPAAKNAEVTARRTFEEGILAETLPTFTLPIELSEAFFDQSGLGVQTAFKFVGLVRSTSDARRAIKSGSLMVNDIPVIDERMVLRPSDRRGSEGVIKLSLGRKRHVLLKPV